MNYRTNMASSIAARLHTAGLCLFGVAVFIVIAASLPRSAAAAQLAAVSPAHSTLRAAASPAAEAPASTIDLSPALEPASKRAVRRLTRRTYVEDTAAANMEAPAAAWLQLPSQPSIRLRPGKPVPGGSGLPSNRQRAP